MYLSATLTIWLLVYQPAVARPITPPERLLILAGLWGLLALFTTGHSQGTDNNTIQQLERSRWTGVIITLTTILLLIFGIEIWMRYFLLMPDGINKTQMNHNWIRVHGLMEPKNTLNYRDYEPDTNAEDDIQRVIIVGDSFAAGQGIADIDDIFTQQLAQMLGEDYTVNLVGEAGAATGWQYNQLSLYPIDPDIVILSYYLNDIEGIVINYEDNLTGVSPTSDPEGWFTNFIIEKTHLGNFLYWRAFYPQHIANIGGYASRTLDFYANETYWREHSLELQQFANLKTEQDIEVIVLIWPFLRDIDLSESIVNQVADYFTDRDISVIYMGDMLEEIPVNDRVVSPFDAHPGLISHTMAAEVLYSIVTELEE